MRDDLKWSELRRERDRLEQQLLEAKERIAALETEVHDDDRLRTSMAGLLTDTANALKGQPEPRRRHSWHDLPDWAGKSRSVVMYYLAATAPGATHIERENFILALNAWRDLFGRDLFDSALAFAELEKPA